MRPVSLLPAALCLLMAAACNREPVEAPAAANARPSSSTPTDDRAPTAATPRGSLAPPTIDDDAPLPPSVTMPSADTDTPMMAEGATVTYGCDDGNLVVAYGDGSARMTLPDGSRSAARLSVEASARAGGEVYVGDRVGLQRLGSAVEVQGADHSVRRCVETSSDA